MRHTWARQALPAPPNPPPAASKTRDLGSSIQSFAGASTTTPQGVADVSAVYVTSPTVGRLEEGLAWRFFVAANDNVGAPAPEL